MITGITGQDGLYLAAYLLFHQDEYDYQVHGFIRKNSGGLHLLEQLIEILNQFEIGKRRKLILHVGDLTDAMFVTNKIAQIQPDEIYNLAAQSHVAHSFDNPDHTFHVNVHGLLYILTAVVTLKMHDRVKIFHASTSEMFGDGKLDHDNDIINEEF